MKLVRKADLTPITPHSDSQLYRYDNLDMPGVGIVCSEQFAHTVHGGSVPAPHLCYVIQGKLTVATAKGESEVGPGDCMQFEAGEERTISNNGDESALLLLIDGGGKGPGPGPGGPGGPPPGGPGGPPPGGPGGPPPGGPGGPPPGAPQR